MYLCTYVRTFVVCLFLSRSLCFCLSLPPSSATLVFKWEEFVKDLGLSPAVYASQLIASDL